MPDEDPMGDLLDMLVEAGAPDRFVALRILEAQGSERFQKCALKLVAQIPDYARQRVLDPLLEFAGKAAQAAGELP